MRSFASEAIPELDGGNDASRRSRPRWPAALALLAIATVVTTACRSASDTPARQSSAVSVGSSAESGSVRTSGSTRPGGGGAGAPGAPIRIPAKIDDQGLPLDEITDVIRKGVRKECGGSLCIVLKTVHSDPDFCWDTFVKTDPPQHTTVARGETVTIIAGSKQCPSTSTPDPGDTSSTSTEPPPTVSSSAEPPSTVSLSAS